MKYSQKGAILNAYTVIIGVVLIVLVGVVVAFDPLSLWKRMQDEARVASLREIQVALENYYDDFGRYPSSSHEYFIVDAKTKRGIEWGGQWLPYMSRLPEDPSSDRHFVYYSDPQSGNQSYGLYASFTFPFENGVTCSARADTSCTRLPQDTACGEGYLCNSGVSSPNSSP